MLSRCYLNAISLYCPSFGQGSEVNLESCSFLLMPQRHVSVNVIVIEAEIVIVIVIAILTVDECVSIGPSVSGHASHFICC